MIMRVPQEAAPWRLCGAARDAWTQRNRERPLSVELMLMYVYRLMALGIAVGMAVVVWRKRDWQQQVFAAMIFVPFLLRGLGVK